MRIKEKYKKSGYFWLPDNLDRKIPGTLTISDGGEIELEVVGLFEESVKALNSENDLMRVVGHIENDEFVTLDNCFYKKKNFAFGGIAKSLIHVNMVFSGVAYDKEEVATFNTVSFSVEGLNEWLGISGITVSYGDNFRTATISYNPQDEIVYTLIDGFKLHIFFKYTLPSVSSIATEAKITQQAYFKLSSEEAKDFPAFINILHQITYLLCFAVDATVAVHDVSATSNAIMIEAYENKQRPVDIKIYYSSLPFSEELPKINIHMMLFRFCQVRENAEAIINNWLNAYSTIKPALGLYFSSVTGMHRYLDSRFLALAQGLETYHRRTSSDTLMERANFRKLVATLLCFCQKENRKWLKGRLYHGNEISLGQRIKKIIEPYKSYLGNSKERNKLIRGVVNTRNYLTHYSEELEIESVKGVDLWVLCQKMEAIFQLHLLQQLGFTEPEIHGILKDNYKLKKKFSEI